MPNITFFTLHHARDATRRLADSIRFVPKDLLFVPLGSGVLAKISKHTATEVFVFHHNDVRMVVYYIFGWTLN